MPEDREIAGIRCMQVLERLDDYVDGALERGIAGRVEAHVRECDWCTEFGGRYAATVEALRTRLLRSDSADADPVALATLLLASKT